MAYRGTDEVEWSSSSGGSGGVSATSNGAAFANCDNTQYLHRTVSLPGIDGSTGACQHDASDDEAGDSRLKRISVQKARSRDYLVSGSGASLLLGCEQLQLCLPQRQITVLVATWNMNGKPAAPVLDDLVLPEACGQVADLVVVGTQETPPQHQQQQQQPQPQHLDHQQQQQQRRPPRLSVCVQASLGASHVPLHTATLGTLQLCVFIRRELSWHCSVIEEDCYSVRPPTNIKTKGAVAVGFHLFGSSFVFVTCHLTAHLYNQQRRIDDMRRLTTGLRLPRHLPARANTTDVTGRYDNVFWFGDLNFRLTCPRRQVLAHLADLSAASSLHTSPLANAAKLLQHDQLNDAKNKGLIFGGFSEGEIAFCPSYKYDVGTCVYDTSVQQRTPAYTDRILFKSRRQHIRCVQYSAVQEYCTSDHKPVWGLYCCQIRPGLADVPLLAGQFDRRVYLEGLRRRMNHLSASTKAGSDSRTDCCLQ